MYEEEEGRREGRREKGREKGRENEMMALASSIVWGEWRFGALGLSGQYPIVLPDLNLESG